MEGCPVGLDWAMNAVAAWVDISSAFRSASCASSRSSMMSGSREIIRMVCEIGRQESGRLRSMVAACVELAIVSPIFSNWFLYSFMVVR